jgi:hypothetical protein
VWWFLFGLAVGFILGVFCVAACQVAKGREGEQWKR